MKKLFRFHIGEFNGFILQSLCIVPNLIVTEVQHVLTHFKRVAFKNEDELLSYEDAVTYEELRGIGRFAGILPPILSGESNSSSIRFTNSYLYNGVEYSHKGLFNYETDRFSFYPSNTGEITSIASAINQSTLVPEGQPILGYIAEGEDVFDEFGYVDESLLLSVPPVDKAYVPYYGKKFLHFAYLFTIIQELDRDTYLKLFISIQKIRFYGVTITSILELTKLILDTIVYNVYFTQHVSGAIILNYTVRTDTEEQNVTRRLFTWQYIIALHCKQILLEEDV